MRFPGAARGAMLAVRNDRTAWPAVTGRGADAMAQQWRESARVTGRRGFLIATGAAIVLAIPGLAACKSKGSSDNNDPGVGGAGGVGDSSGGGDGGSSGGGGE
ncbi:putative membrane protein YgcG [Kitasatospora sp. MAA4]|uniref:hypothetical protein n=1 Tax=Kitasatospora sp. MAA4 TaxID=3035093 RepID=UPI0024755EFE|nr:hypothetical protein [Kitasatospora sp. MAA4]MDH6135668.1 putative membrane protein YgcG [Kitasatospora sp. MAA4]